MGYRNSCVKIDATVHNAIACIEASDVKVALVVDEDLRLVGTITDGDIRRALLSGVNLGVTVDVIMNKRPQTALNSQSLESLIEYMKQHRLRHLPIIDEEGRLTGLKNLTDLLVTPRKDNWVVLMAGGKGLRLRPLTENIPKPMLAVGAKPILETIIDSFASAGFYKFFLSLNYKAELIEEYFGDGSHKGIQISYLKEVDELGTAGSLGLLPDMPSEPFFVMNGDILTKVDFLDILSFHEEHDAVGTMCVREQELHIPYGVVDIAGPNLLGISEKPIIRHLVNAGIYILEPHVLEQMENNVETTMPQIFERLISRGDTCCVCPIREYWMDVGQPADFEKANREFSVIFND